MKFLRKINDFINILIGCSIGVYIGRCIFKYWDYKSHPGLYELTSAPWYLSLQVMGLFTLIIVLILLVIKFIIKKRLKTNDIV